MPTEPREKVQVWIRYKDKDRHLFLLLKTCSERGGFWQPVTGSVENGERVEHGALREMEEETGLKPASLRAVSEPFEFTGRYGLVREFPFLAEVTAEDRTQVRLDAHEHVTYQWCSAESALELIKYESNAKVLREILK